MKKIGFQLFNIRDYLKFRDMGWASIKRIAEIGYTQVQISGMRGLSAEEYAAIFKEFGLELLGTHYGWDDILNNTDETMRVHEALGTTNIGIGSMPLEPRSSKEELLKFIDKFNEVAEKVNKHGFKLTYHNHSFEFHKFDGKTIFDYLIDGFNPMTTSFVFDTYWTQHGGADVRAMLERLSGRIDYMHLKDMGAFDEQTKAPYITTLGMGNINFKDIIPLAEKTGVKAFAIEQDSGWIDNDPFISAKSSYDYLKTNGLLG